MVVLLRIFSALVYLSAAAEIFCGFVGEAVYSSNLKEAEFMAIVKPQIRMINHGLIKLLIIGDRKMSTRLYIFSFSFLLFVISNVAITDSSEQYVSELGVSEGAPIDKGFVIIEGNYLDPPYTVSRRGLAIYINEIKISKPVRHPGEKHAFGGLVPKNMTSGMRFRYSKVLETARKVYEMNLQKGQCYIFEKGGHKIVNLYTVVYNTPEQITQLYKVNQRLESRINNLYNSLLKIEEFGIKSSESVNNGFVFINGKYIEAPYIVSRKGLSLFINDKMIQPPLRLPEKNITTEYIEYEDPKMPSTISIDSTKYDPDVTEYLGLKRAYYLQNYSENEAVKLMAITYFNLPCVKDAKVVPDEPGVITITWYNGEIYRVKQYPPPLKGARMIKMDEPSILERLERQLRNYEERLKKDDYYFLSRSAPRITGSKAGAINVLPKILPILRSSSSYEEKLIDLKKLKQQDLYDLGKEILKHIQSNRFQASNQLEIRLSELTKSK